MSLPIPFDLLVDLSAFFSDRVEQNRRSSVSRAAAAAAPLLPVSFRKHRLVSSFQVKSTYGIGLGAGFVDPLLSKVQIYCL
mmetsp:Transcript_32790/g.52949  ORF Transcript_32790/g.52949 Transcript_32790/m.52949 type:complete len:81 (-) Transcript_32790:81-323(-)